MHDTLRPNGFVDFTPSTQQSRDSALLRATTELFVQEPAHDDDEIHRYEELAIHLIPKVRAEDRALVAERLAARLDAPPSVIRVLARDQIEIAEPVLRRSPVLGQLDLLAIIGATGPAHHHLIAERPGLSPEVTRALGISGDRELAAMLDQVDAALQVPAEADQSRGGADATGAVRPRADSLGAREAVASKVSRFDPWLFLGLERSARLRLMAELASRPPIRHYGGPMGRLDRAFRSILGAAQIVGFARSGQQKALVDAIVDGLEVETDFVVASLGDATGEPLAVLLKGLGLDSTQAQQVFLLAASKVGRDVTAFFKLCDLYAGMEPVVAETLIDSWRGHSKRSSPRHEPLFGENGERRRGGVVDPAREKPAAAADRPNRNTG